LAAVPEIGRAARIEPSVAPGAEQTRDLFERFGGQIYGYCLHQLGSREEAEDAVQMTFMNVFRGLQRGIVPRVEGAWLFKIAHNVCLSRRRSTRRRGRVEAPNNFEVLQDIVPARDRSADELIRLHDALEGMPETQRRAILLREWRGLSYREIADELQLSQAAVETLIFRARRTLAAGLKELGAETRRRRRSQYSIDASGLLAAAKAIFGGGTAVKMAAVAVVATTAIASADLSHPGRPAVRHVRPHARTGAAAVVRGLPPTYTHRGRTGAVRSSSLGSAVRPHTRATSFGTQRGVAVRRRFVPHEGEDARAEAAVKHAAPAARKTADARPPHATAPKQHSARATTQAPKPVVRRVGHAKHDQRAPVPAAAVVKPPQSSPPSAEAASQPAPEHGPETAPGQQNKADSADEQHGSGH
jgi:RNA polymerase sigma-70 factor (ECF subfamily)